LYIDTAFDRVHDLLNDVLDKYVNNKINDIMMCVNLPTRADENDTSENIPLSQLVLGRNNLIKQVFYKKIYYVS
jgi:hypothetical protein